MDDDMLIPVMGTEDWGGGIDWGFQIADWGFIDEFGLHFALNDSPR
jgi:hypothetical protein